MKVGSSARDRTLWIDRLRGCMFRGDRSLDFTPAGVRTDRKSYLVGAAPAEDRPLYTAFSNTRVAALARPLGAGLIGPAYGASAALAAVLAATALAYLLVTAMPEAEDMTS